MQLLYICYSMQDHYGKVNSKFGLLTKSQAGLVSCLDPRMQRGSVASGYRANLLGHDAVTCCAPEENHFTNMSWLSYKTNMVVVVHLQLI